MEVFAFGVVLLEPVDDAMAAETVQNRPVDSSLR